MLPRWAQTVAQFMPASYLVSGMQGILTQHESLLANWKSAGALVVTLGLAIFVAMRLFRWEKDEKLKGAAKLWVAGVMVPFVRARASTSSAPTSRRSRTAMLFGASCSAATPFLIRNAGCSSATAA